MKHKGERLQSSYCNGPVVQGETTRLLTYHPGGTHGDEEPSGINLPSGRVPGSASDSPPELGLMVTACRVTFLENNGHLIVFRVEGIL